MRDPSVPVLAPARRRFLQAMAAAGAAAVLPLTALAQACG
ncbi:cellulase, partial [Mycobacterium tuberculosis]